MTVTTCAPTVEVDVADIHVTYREVELPSACPRCDADLRGTEGNAGRAVVEHHFRLVPRLGHLAPGRGFVPEGRDEPEAGVEISGQAYGCGTCGEVLARGILEEHRTGELDLCKRLEVINLGEVGVTLGDLLAHAIGGVKGLEPTVYEGGGLTQFKTTDGRWWCVLYEVRLRELARLTCDGCDAEINLAEVGQEGPERVLCRRCWRKLDEEEAGQQEKAGRGGEAGREGEAGEVAEAGQEAEPQEGQDPAGTASGIEGPGSKPGRRGRRKGGRA